MEQLNPTNTKSRKIKLDFKDSKYATGRRKRSIAKSLGKKRFRKHSCKWLKNE